MPGMAIQLKKENDNGRSADMRISALKLMRLKTLSKDRVFQITFR